MTKWLLFLCLPLSCNSFLQVKLHHCSLCLTNSLPFEVLNLSAFLWRHIYLASSGYIYSNGEINYPLLILPSLEALMGAHTTSVD